ncbi:MAG: IS630 family transposase [Pyrinomonadaceae bacterium]
MFKKLNCRYKRIRKRLKDKETEEVYRHKREILGELENLSENQLIDLYYGDESRVPVEPCVPYGWQFPDEEVSMPLQKGGGLNCFALLTRHNQCLIETSELNIDSRFIFERLETFSTKLQKPAVIVLDNARIHTSKIIKERIKVWRHKGLYIFYLPRYSPHLNIVETLWRKLKYEWLSPTAYQNKENLFYQIRLALTAVGNSLFIRFSKFRHTLY